MYKYAFALLFPLWALLSLQFADLPARSSDSASLTAYFPEVSGRNIDNEAYALPGDFEGEYNVVLMAFSWGQQRTVNTWLGALRTLESEIEGIRVYELPTLPEFSQQQRDRLDRMMSAGISDPLARESTITLYTDLGNLQDALDVPNTSTVRLFLVDRAGNIYWRSQGSYSQNQFEELANLVSALVEDER
ncbi:MAG: hypothetical protein SWY16_25455 [Cyanobacteriota bacterium]|nr:hypothetical protein [Cyanobacteriota bacterium]